MLASAVNPSRAAVFISPAFKAGAAPAAKPKSKQAKKSKKKKPSKRKRAR